MKPLSRFNIILAIVSIILVLAGSFLMDGTRTGYYLLYPGLFLAVIFSLTSLVDVFKATEISPGRRILWIIMTVSVPVLGGMLFYFINHRRSEKDDAVY